MSSTASIIGGASASDSATWIAWLAVISGDTMLGLSSGPTRIAGEILRASGSRTLSMNQGAGRFLKGRENSWPHTSASAGAARLNLPRMATHVRRFFPLNSAGGVDGRWRT